MKRKPVVVDLFCGAGGESQGIHWAAEKNGVELKLFAVNHWERAIITHSTNFPQYESLCRDVFDVHPRKVVGNERISLLWGSPSCVTHSNARGGRPLDDYDINQDRISPNAILDWLSDPVIAPDRVIIENVKEFVNWGPVGNDGKPIKERKGETFRAYISMIRSMGYIVDWRLMNAADFGAPTTRIRLFIQCVRIGSGKRLMWPEATHAAMPGFGADALLTSGLKPWIPARDIIDWSIPTQLIDNRKKPLADNTMRRIMQGVERYWGDGAKPFITRYNGGENRNHSIDDPVPTLDTSNRYGLVEPFILEERGNKRQIRKVSDPLSTIATSGAHHALVEPLIMEYYGNGQCKPVSQPVGTVTTKERFALLEHCRVGIGFRMLQPHELALAQSFNKDYQITGNKTEIVKQIGNAVCPNVAEALAEDSFRRFA